MNFSKNDEGVFLRAAKQALNHGFRQAIANTSGLLKSMASLGVMAAILLPVDSYGVAVTTQHNNNYRTGQNDQETILNVSNVNVNRFGKLYTYDVAALFNSAVSDVFYTQILYLPNVNIPGKGVHNVLYGCSNVPFCFAVDADSNTPLWKASLGRVLSTPVIDPVSNTLYVVSRSNAYSIDHSIQYYLHALDVATGYEKSTNSPIQINGSVFGNGTASVNGILKFDAFNSAQKVGLLLLKGNIYIAFSGGNEKVNQHGWMFSYNAQTLQFNSVISTSPDGNLTSIWQSGTGIAADPNGFIYVHTGNNLCFWPTILNCTFTTDYSNSLLKIDTSNNGLNIVDYFTPSNQKELNQLDLDLSSTGPLLIPGTSIGVSGAKDGRLYVWSENNLGQYSPIVNQVLQYWQLAPWISTPQGYKNNGLFGGNVFYDGSTRFQMPGKQTIYTGTRTGKFFAWVRNGYLESVNFNNQSFDENNVAKGTEYAPRGVGMSISSNGIQPGSGILWAYSNDASNTTGIVRAYDVSNTSTVLWDSSQNSVRDGGLCKNIGFGIPPTVVNGKIYVPDSCGKISVYGLLPN